MSVCNRISIPYRFIVLSFFILTGFIRPALSNEPKKTENTCSEQTVNIDSTKMTLGRGYFLWKSIITKTMILLPQAKNEYTADDRECIDRIAMYRSTFPGIPIDDKLVKIEIIIEKYLRNSENISISPEQVEKEYASLRSQLLNVPLPSMSDILPIISSRALFNSATVLQICREKENKLQAEQQSIEQNNNWSSEELTLNSDNNECLVIAPKDSCCIVTVGEFNTFLLLQPILKKIDKVKARELLLNSLLRKYFISGQARKENVHFTDRQFEAMQYQIGNKLLGTSIFKTDIKEDELIVMYNKYYTRFFRDHEIKTVSIVGSTDSLYIDSLYQNYLKIMNIKDQNKFLEQNRFISSLPWIQSTNNDLPGIINSKIDTLRIQDVCTIHVPFGHFLCRVISDRHQLKTRPEEATPKLKYLISEERKRFGGKSESERALEYYNQHSDHYKTPDTLQVKTWLVPCNSAKSIPIEPASSTIQKDTSTFSSQMIFSYQLPREVEDRLQQAYKSNKKKGASLIGPIQSRFGNWYFKVENLRPGGTTLPIDSVMPEILNHIQIQNFPLDTVLTTDRGQRVFNYEVLSRALYDNISSTIDSIPIKEIEQGIRSQTIGVSYKEGDTINDRLVFEARMKLVDNKVSVLQQQINEWIGTLKINTAILKKQ